mmetsp:Transcript_1619/g.1436  ORF Transcript_1619/g.1436 Transcript_1619/m.1436 type:complete len:96 (+) Transcript_1619:669-956(+)
MISQLLLSEVIGQSLSSMWTLINTLQLIYYSGLMTLYFPLSIFSFIGYIAVVNLENETFSDVYALHFDKSKLEKNKSWDYRFNNLSIETTSILLN